MASEPDMPDIGHWLRAHRLQRGYSLDRLAAESKVSRAMLSQIELGNSQPTLKVMVRIAHALHVPLASVMESGDAVLPFILRAERASRIRRTELSIERKPLFPNDARRTVEFYELHFARNASESADPREPESTENIIILSGVLEIQVAERRMVLCEGDAAYYRADKNRAYRSVGSKGVVAYLVVCRNLRAIIDTHRAGLQNKPTRIVHSVSNVEKAPGESSTEPLRGG